MVALSNIYDCKLSLFHNEFSPEQSKLSELLDLNKLHWNK